LEKVKLVAAVRAVTVNGWTVGVVLQVTDNLAPKLESSVRMIWLLAVTAVVFT
jgi:hypothetical protein